MLKSIQIVIFFFYFLSTLIFPQISKINRGGEEINKQHKTKKTIDGIIIDCDVDRIKQTFNKNNQVNIIGNAVTPLVVRYDRDDPILLEVTLAGTATKVEFQYTNGTKQLLSDDGVNGDKIKGDNIYSLTFTKDQVLSLLNKNNVFRPKLGMFNVYEGDKITTAGLCRVQIWTQDIPIIDVHDISESIQYTNSLVNIESYNNDINKITNIFYDFFEDNYDFINIIYSNSPPENRHHLLVQNNINGIGLDSFDYSENYGSHGKLLGINVFPVPFIFDGADNGYVHEIGHQWINFLWGDPIRYGYPHWPFSDLFNSTMGANPSGAPGASRPWKLEKNNDGYKIVYDRTEPYTDIRYFFSDIGLYLMGLLPADNVSTHLVFKDSQNYKVINGQYNDTDFVKVTIDDIIKINNQREPDYNLSQRNYNIATIFVSNKLLPDEAMYFYNYFSKRAELKYPVAVTESILEGMSNPFYVATQGKATLNTQINIKISPYQTLLSEPINNAMVDSNDITMKWNPVSNADSYHLQLASDSLFDLIFSEDLDVVKNYYLIRDLEKNKKYYWHVRAKNNIGIGTWSDIWNFTTSPPTAINDKIKLPIKFSLYANYPNPFNPTTTIKYVIPQQSFVNIAIYNLLGEKLVTLVNEEKSPGNYEVIFDGSSLASGVYFYRMQADNFFEVKKLILLK